MPVKTPIYRAALRGTSFSQSRIDKENGVIYGVKIAKLGKKACFAGPDGKPRSIVIEPEHVEAFLAHSKGRSVPVHWTHDYLSGDKDALHAKVGALKETRVDADGDPVGDLYVGPSEHRDKILWNAEHDDTGMMLSAVFNYCQDDARAIPQNFMAADLVENGAATVALFSATNPDTDMTPEEIKELVKAALSEALPTAITAALADAKANDDKEAAAALEAAEGVTDEDKKPEDEGKPCMMAAFTRVGRARERRHAAAMAAVEDNAAVKAEAAFTNKIGNGGFKLATGGGENADAVAKFEGAVSSLVATGQTRARAILNVQRNNPEIAAAREQALRA